MKKGYTFVELLATVSIIVVLAVAGIPIFSSYQIKSTYSQKIEEIDSLFKQIFIFSSNPEKDVKAYAISLISGDEFVLQACFDDECTETARKSSVFLDDGIKIENTAVFENRNVTNESFVCLVPGDECYIKGTNFKNNLTKDGFFLRLSHEKIDDSGSELIVRTDPYKLEIR